MKKDFLFRALPALFLAFSISSLVMAQGVPSGGVEPVESVPVDGGASLLLAGGVVYGLQKLRNRRKMA